MFISGLSSSLFDASHETTWSRKWQPTLAFLPGKFHGQRNLAGYSLWGRKNSAMTERWHACTGEANDR